MKDYEQLYYDSQYEIKNLKNKIKDLESELQYIDKRKMKNIQLKQIIIQEFKKYKDSKKE